MRGRLGNSPTNLLVKAISTGFGMEKEEFNFLLDYSHQKIRETNYCFLNYNLKNDLFIAVTGKVLKPV